jgi:hypothetical protein
MIEHGVKKGRLPEGDWCTWSVGEVKDIALDVSRNYVLFYNKITVADSGLQTKRRAKV